MSFKVNLEASADSKGTFKIPPELLDVHIMDKLKISYPDLQATPAYIIERLLFLWHLQDIAQKAQERRTNSNSG